MNFIRFNSHYEVIHKKGFVKMESLDKKVLHLIEEDPRLTPENLATMLDKEKGEIKDIIKKFAKQKGKKPEEIVNLLNTKKPAPELRDKGYDKVAEKIYNYPEVKDMYLMSGGFDFTVIIEGKSMKEVALFVAEKLAPSDGVISTATHFVLRKYKTEGVIHGAKATEDKRERGLLI